METWKPIPDWEVYEVSDKGRVRRIKSGRILAQSLRGTYTKYHSVHLSKNNKQKRHRHRHVTHWPRMMQSPSQSGKHCIIHRFYAIMEEYK